MKIRIVNRANNDRTTEYTEADIQEELFNLKKDAGLKPRGASVLTIYQGSDESPTLTFFEFGTGRRRSTVI